MSAELNLLDGLVVVSDEPFTSVVFSGSKFERWSPERIEIYRRDLQKWNRWGWVNRVPRVGPVVAALLGVPLRRPINRQRSFMNCVFVDGKTTSNALTIDKKDAE
jgi:hypothetical protein